MKIDGNREEERKNGDRGKYRDREEDRRKMEIERKTEKWRQRGRCRQQKYDDIGRRRKPCK